MAELKYKLMSRNMIIIFSFISPLDGEQIKAITGIVMGANDSLHGNWIIWSGVKIPTVALRWAKK